MKKAVIFIALCGLIFAGIANICNACPNWGRFLPKPIVVPVDSFSTGGDVNIAIKDLRRYLPLPIVVPDSIQYSKPIEMATAPISKDPPIPWIIKTRTSNTNEKDLSVAPVAKDPPIPWIIKTRTA